MKHLFIFLLLSLNVLTFAQNPPCSPSYGIDTVSLRYYQSSYNNGYTWINGITYTTDTDNVLDTIVGGATSGCDSIVSLWLTFCPGYGDFRTDESHTACHSFVWWRNGRTYTYNTSYTFNCGGFNPEYIYYSNASPSGCDSSAYLNLIVHPQHHIKIQSGSLFATPEPNKLPNDYCNRYPQAANYRYEWVDCNSGNVIQGATSKFFSPSQTGTYAAQVFMDSSCTSITPCLYFEVNDTLSSSLSTLPPKIHPTIYPNPSVGQFTIEFDEFKNTTLRIFNLDGRLIHQKEYTASIHNNNTILVDLEIERGIYMLEVQKEAFRSIHKLLIH